MMERLVCMLIGYCFGMIQTAYIYGKKRGIDIRTKGSGNAGTTNMLRTFGTKVGLITLGLDTLKCILAVLVTWLIFRNTWGCAFRLLGLYTSAGVILGHNYPFYLSFKGGKGIAATCGLIIAFCDPRLVLIAAICFFGCYLVTKYVSLGSLTMYVGFFAGLVVFGQHGDYHVTQRTLNEMYILVACLAAMAFFKHRGNIKRLVTGTERKTYLTKHHE